MFLGPFFEYVLVFIDVFTSVNRFQNFICFNAGKSILTHYTLLSIFSPILYLCIQSEKQIFSPFKI